MATTALKNGNMKEPLLGKKANAGTDELAAYRESAIAYLIRCGTPELPSTNLATYTTYSIAPIVCGVCCQ